MNRRAKYLEIDVIVCYSIHEIRATDRELRTYNVGDFHQAGDIVSFGLG